MESDDYRKRRREFESALEELGEQRSQLEKLKDELLQSEREAKEWTSWFEDATRGIPGMGSAARNLSEEDLLSASKSNAELDDMGDLLASQMKDISRQIDELDAAWREETE